MTYLLGFKATLLRVERAKSKNDDPFMGVTQFIPKFVLRYDSIEEFLVTPKESGNRCKSLGQRPSVGGFQTTGTLLA